MTMETVTVSRPIRWRYESFTLYGTCRLVKDKFGVRMVLERDDLTQAPDVCDIEEWLRQTLTEPTTAEDLAIAAADHWKMRATIHAGPTKTHGIIVVVAEPK